jgi:hypothetical protein
VNLLINVVKLSGRFLVMTVMAMFAQTVQSHTTGENYAFLNIDEDALRVRLELHQNDLESTFGLQLQDEVPPEAELAPVLAYALDRFEVHALDQPLAFDFESAEVMSLPQGRFLALHLEAAWPGPLPDRLTVHQALFFDEDPRHRGLLLIEKNAVIEKDFGYEYTALVFSPDDETQELDLVDVPRLTSLRQFLWQRHIQIARRNNCIRVHVVAVFPDCAL